MNITIGFLKSIGTIFKFVSLLIVCSILLLCIVAFLFISGLLLSIIIGVCYCLLFSKNKILRIKIIFHKIQKTMIAIALKILNLF